MFDPPPLMELAVQSALYRTHKRQSDQKTDQKPLHFKAGSCQYEGLCLEG